MRISEGRPYPLGATADAGGTNFAVFLVIGGSIWIIANLDANMMTIPGDIPR